ncbi:UPF0716 protein FxsA [Desulfitispora alkaliphila]|uniref:FxsA family protein n=1 Tax=Desulfitispora alkaliphila TaxID=622674 RepID=UPI003D24C08B
MFGKLLIIFIGIPLVELLLLIELGKIIGTLYTIGLIFLTGTFGVLLTKAQGFLAVRNIQMAMARGEMPGDQLLDGLFILIGGVVLLTPGLLTDVFGFACLIPATRSWMKRVLLNRLRYWHATGRVQIFIK